MSACPCGKAEAHVVMRRETVDGITVCLWSDGAVTGALGRGLRGVPMRRPRTPATLALALRAGRLLLGELCLWGLSDLPDLYAAAERAARGDGLPGTMRHLHGARRERQRPPCRLQWTVTRADRRGRTVERWSSLPRLGWPGLIVVDYCGGAGSKRGRYVVMRARFRGGDVLCEPTGFAFRTLGALYAHLRSTSGFRAAVYTDDPS